MPENRRLFGPMTVLENLQMGAYLHGGGDPRGLRARVRALPAPARAARAARGHALGRRAADGRDGPRAHGAPEAMLMDEPSMGLAPILVERSFEIIQQVHEAGVAILVVEQNANVSLSIADRGYVLSTGRVVARGQGIRADPSTTSSARPTSGDEMTPGRRRSAARVPDLRARRVRELVLAGRALRAGSGGRRGLARGLGRERRRVGLLGRAERGRARRVRAGCCTPSPTRSP